MIKQNKFVSFTEKIFLASRGTKKHLVFYDDAVNPLKQISDIENSIDHLENNFAVSSLLNFLRNVFLPTIFLFILLNFTHCDTIYFLQYIHILDRYTIVMHL